MARKKEIEVTENAVEEKENTAKKDKDDVEENATQKYELSFSKQAFLSSKTYKPHRDLLGTILENGKSYRKSEVNKLIDDYLKGKVR